MSRTVKERAKMARRRESRARQFNTRWKMPETTVAAQRNYESTNPVEVCSEKSAVSVTAYTVESTAWGAKKNKLLRGCDRHLMLEKTRLDIASPTDVEK